MLGSHKLCLVELVKCGKVTMEINGMLECKDLGNKRVDFRLAPAVCKRKVTSTTDISRGSEYSILFPKWFTSSWSATRTWRVIRPVSYIQLSSDHFKDSTSVQRVHIHPGSHLCLTRISDAVRALALNWYTVLCTQTYEVTVFLEKSCKRKTSKASRTFPLLTACSRTLLGKSTLVRWPINPTSFKEPGCSWLNAQDLTPEPYFEPD
jgi:hypothetical protein